ncbi:MAG: hypothetical protein K2X82_06270 [Gemmataceae bacterium]|nr:hypothetical protein [Gemmataceae bacterium]
MPLRPLTLAAAFLAAAVPAAAADGPVPPAGLYRLATVGPAGESAVCVLKLEAKDGKPAAAVVGSPPMAAVTVSEVKADGGLTFTVNEIRSYTDNKGNISTYDAGTRTFVAGPGAAGGPVRGSLGTERYSSRAVFAPTDTADLGKDDKGKGDKKEKVATPGADPWQTVTDIQGEVGKLRRAVRETREPAKVKVRKAAYDAAQKAADAELPALYRAVVEKHPDTPAGQDAAAALVRMAEKAKLTPAEAETLAALVVKQATPYGPRYTRPLLTDLADDLNRVKGLEPVALGVVGPVAGALTDADPPTARYDVLATYRAALEGAGKADEAKAVGERLAALDAALDKEYLATVPPFKPGASPGRKDPAANRVAVVELFTGAQCPPCVAADVAFDAAHKAYKPADVVLLQYHLHIPGPDPLTNPDTVARWDYYLDLFPYDPDAGTGVIGTPTTLFNGKPEKKEYGGGGPMSESAEKFRQYKEALDPLLEAASPVKLAGTAARAGDKLDITVDVSGAPAGAKLRLLVVEDTVKYVGSNRVRFHHQIVRAMPGGAEGVALPGGSFRHAAGVDLGAVRKDLTKYLDEYAATERPFPKPDRPLALDKLGVVALVQDDKTGEIFQAARIEVGGK